MGLLGLRDSATNYGAGCKASDNCCGIGSVVTAVMMPRAMMAWAVMAMPIVSTRSPPSVTIPLNILDGMVNVRFQGGDNWCSLSRDRTGQRGDHGDQKYRYLLHLLFLE
ncbi:hypothetical protein J2W42_006680 [Rhizobium tibeticum]|uniref:hypothetical protein n=1 Tax=Rhizobium tibeticum TaxID=501024 RepID=UPI002787E720|nr:hypothetical protein [Rhizobium tibeticum]MDP9813804.1 hypothetical protein [Rhizobium tibeticum]